MTASEIIKLIMTRKGVSQSKMATLIGVKSQANITGILNRGTSLKVANVEKLVEPLGYKIMIVPEDTPIPNNGFVVEEEI